MLLRYLQICVAYCVLKNTTVYRLFLSKRIPPYLPQISKGSISFTPYQRRVEYGKLQSEAARRTEFLSAQKPPRARILPQAATYISVVTARPARSRAHRVIPRGNKDPLDPSYTPAHFQKRRIALAPLVPRTNEKRKNRRDTRGVKMIKKTALRPCLKAVELNL